ncbi:MAG: hypothetical protein J5803_02205 [Desulfovibrio sp.]|nr:hypothetical protein [Desulfovibrio sp.]
MNPDLWHALCLPLLRLLLGLSIALFIAQALEALHWSRHLTKLCKPLSDAAHFGLPAQGAFALAFISPIAANALLSEHYSQGTLTKKELILSNLFNSFPAYLVHTPTLFFLSWPILGWKALIYVGLSLLAAILRTFLTLLLSRFLLKKNENGDSFAEKASSKPVSLRSALHTAWKKFLRRIPRLLLWTIPIYILMYSLQVHGIFSQLNTWLGHQSFWNSLFSPQAASIIVLHFLAELGSALGACGSLLATGALDHNEVILALLIGNIVSTPVRALRHQLPSYAGLFTPKTGLQLICLNQTLRAFSMTLVTIAFAISL